MTRRYAPSIPAISLILWWIVPSLIFPERLLNADGDLLRHIGHGEWMLRHHALIHADPFSFTRAGQPFVGFEYGSQLIFALVHRAAGLAGVAIFAGLLIGTAYALFARFLLSRGADPLLTYLATVAAAVLGASHWAARPHLFTLVAVVALMALLEPGRQEDGKAASASLRGAPKGRDEAIESLDHPIASGAWRPRNDAALAFVLFAVWANLHAGFVFGLGLIGVYLAGHVIEYQLGNDRGTERGEIRRLAVLLGAGVLGTLVNPHFLALHRHIIAFFGQPFLTDNTFEFMSPDFHGVFGKLLMGALFMVIVLLAVSPRRPHAARLLAILAMTYLTLTARRNVQLFGIVVPAIMVLLFDDAWRRLPDWRGIRAVFQRDAPLGHTAPFVTALCLGFGALALSHGQVLHRTLVPNTVSVETFPVGVVRRARAEHVEGRIFHSFIWGGYLIYAWPEQKVFIDGGTDFYGPALMRSWMEISGLAPGWQESLDTFGISLALVSPNSPFAHELLREPGWQLRDCDATAVLLQKSGGPSMRSTADSLLDACDKKASGP